LFGRLFTTPTPGRITTELSRHTSWSHLSIGDGGLVVQGNPVLEHWRLTCNQWILD